MLQSIDRSGRGHRSLQNPAEKPPITVLLHAWRSGDESALERLIPLIYEDLREVARRSIARKPTGVTIQATSLVNEMFLRSGERDGHRMAGSRAFLRCRGDNNETDSDRRGEGQES